jgi:hypothetical protein
MTSAWFAVSFTGILRGGLTMVTITSVEDYTKECFSKEDALTKFLVPYVYAKDLDLHAEKFLKKYCPRALETPMPFRLKKFSKLCVLLYILLLSRMGFLDEPTSIAQQWTFTKITTALKLFLQKLRKALFW